MSIGLIVTRGFGNGTLTTDIAHAVTFGYDIAVQAVTPESIFSVFGLIQGKGFGVLSMIDANGFSSLADISQTYSVSSTIEERGHSVIMIINETGQSSEGDI